MRALILPFVLSVFLYSCDNGSQDKSAEHEWHANDIEYWDALIKKFPENGNFYHQRALLYFQKGNAEEAIKDINRAVRYDSLAAPFFVSRGKIFASVLEMEEAMESFDRALRLDSSEAQAYLGVGKIYYLIRNYPKALNNLNSTLKIDPYEKEAYFYKGMIFKELNDFKSAASSFQTAIEQDPNYYDAYVELGILYAGMKDPIAVEYFNSALRIDSMGIDAHYAKAKYYQDIDSLDIAFKLYQNISEKIDPYFAQAYFNRGYMYMISKNVLDSALYFFEKSIEVNPEYTQAYHNIGLIYELKGDKVNAEQYYKNALKTDKNFLLSIEALQKLHK